MGSEAQRGSSPTVPGYQLLRRAGRGGTGEVFEAVRVGPGGFRKRVALKRLVPDEALDGRARQRFLEEAYVTAQLEHPNLVRVHDVIVSDGELYIVMELLRGTNLAQMVDALRAAGDLPRWLPLAIAAQALDGLGYAHDAGGDDGRPLGLVHRDVTPSNLFVCHDGTVRVLDFGIAKRRHGPSLTTQKRIRGTLDFLSPEQARGERVDLRSDLYQLGATLYWCLSGSSPHGEGTAGELLARAAAGKHAPLEGVEPEVAALVERALALHPEDRFASAGEMAASIRAALASTDHGPPAITAVITGAQLGDPPERQTISATGSQEIVTATTNAPAAPTPTFAAEARTRSRPLAWATAAIALVAAGVVAGRALIPLSSPRSPAGPRFLRLTARRGVVGNARFVPGTDRFVYSAAWEGGRYRLYEGSVGNVIGRQLDLPEAELLAIHDRELFVLIDLTQVEPLRIGTLARVPLDGGAPRELAKDVVSADVAPDGRIAVIRASAGRMKLELPLGHPVAEVRMYQNYPLRFSPSGRQLAYVTHPKNMDAGVVMRVDADGRIHQVGQPWTSVHSVVWVGEDTLWIAGSREGGHDHIVATTLDGRERVVAESTTDLAVTDLDASAHALALSIAPVARTVADLRGDGHAAYLPVYAGGVIALATPDARWLVAADVQGETDNALAIFKVPATGDAPPAKIGNGYPAAVSPDGESLLARTVANDALQLIPIEVGQTRSVPIAPLRDVGGAGWFPDRSHLLASGHDEQGRLATIEIDLARSSARVVGRPGLFVPGPIATSSGRPVSPDGLLACLGDETTPDRLLYRFADGHELPIPHHELDEYCVGWTPDSKYALVSSRTARGAIDQIDVVSGARTRWKTVPPLDQAGVVAYMPSWLSSDGSHYLFLEHSLTTTLFMLDHLR